MQHFFGKKGNVLLNLGPKHYNTLYSYAKKIYISGHPRENTTIT